MLSSDFNGFDDLIQAIRKEITHYHARLAESGYLPVNEPHGRTAFRSFELLSTAELHVTTCVQVAHMAGTSIGELEYLHERVNRKNRLDLINYSRREHADLIVKGSVESGMPLSKETQKCVGALIALDKKCCSRAAAGDLKQLFDTRAPITDDVINSAERLFARGGVEIKGSAFRKAWCALEKQAAMTRYAATNGLPGKRANYPCPRVIAELAL